MEDNHPEKYLVLIVGPTAVGKTALSLKLAKIFGTEIISCDSRQFYRELEIGTAKPSAQELAEVPHHLIDSLSIHEPYDVRKFEQDALTRLDRLFADHQVVVMTGGSGLFADAVVQGFDPIPEVGPEIRPEVIGEYGRHGLGWLQQEVRRVDPEYFQQVDQKNPQRLMRALEVYRGTGRPFSSFRKKKLVKRPFQITSIGLEMDREQLYARIDERMDQMISQGLFEEAEALFPLRELNALQTVGYSEIFGFLAGEYSREEAVHLLKRNSRRYAKRQLTWFKKDPNTRWFRPSEEAELIQYVKDQVMG